MNEAAAVTGIETGNFAGISLSVERSTS